MNFQHNTFPKFSLLELMAEQLLQKELSISFLTINETEFLSVSSHISSEENLFIFQFDPTENNATDLFTAISLLYGRGNKIIIVVNREGEQEILRNVLTMQEIENAEVLCLPQLKNYSLQIL